MDRQPYPSLYQPDFEHDACGVGFIANIRGHASYDILDRAIIGLKNLAHRGAIDADAITGDGAGVLTQIPYELFQEILQENGHLHIRNDNLAVGMLFLNRENEDWQREGKRILEECVRKEGMDLLCWREVPVDPSCLGQKAERTRPLILQALISRGAEQSNHAFEQALILAQKQSTRRARLERIEDFYIVSLSNRSITYKGLLNAPQVRRFFSDLKSPLYKTAFAIFHQRFATNTFPDWTRAQPYRMLAHNGEINTIRGNRNNMRAREFAPDHGEWGDRFEDLRPMIQSNMSDSASFDNCLQLLTVGGRSCLHSTAMMMPWAWEQDPQLPKPVRDFYKYHAVMMEPWDGPAAVVFSDGRYVGASLDRNGLRPARYKIFEDDTIILASEVGLVPGWGSKVVETGRLGPGRMIAVDLKEKKVLRDEEIKNRLAGEGSYSEWCDHNIINLHVKAGALELDKNPQLKDEEIQANRKSFGYDLDEEDIILKPMMKTGKEPIGSMGDDTPLAVLSRRPRLIYTYFKQLFAQVTNPAIDSLRESLVMSLKTYLGGRLGIFDTMVQDHRFLALDSPFLLPNELQSIFETDFLADHILTVDATFPRSDGPEGLEVRLSEIRQEIFEEFERRPLRLIHISDRRTGPDRVAIPTVLAVGAVHSELVRMGKRIRCDILAETAEARDVHQMACIVGFGANAIYPYFVYDLIRNWSLEEDEEDEGPKLTPEEGILNYRKALNLGLLKIMSKMGISTLFSYQAAQVFEAVGLSNKVVDECFTETPCPIGGLGYADIAEESLTRHDLGYPEETEEEDLEAKTELWNEGYLTVLKRGEGEIHGWNPKVVSGMNKFIRKGGDYEAFQPFKEVSDDHAPISIRDLFRLREIQSEVSLEEVEPIEDIRRRFTTAGMSLGALSPEMHETLAIAMNSIGGKSNSGEGGEDPRRFHPLENGDDANSAIKQVASGRFGVTAEYLTNAQEIEIKIAQGAKPGEGGQLPGHKVSPLIARLRFSIPGVTLISPPPHHDIYSIEDLAQLIFDLKEVNPRAKVCVKLVSSSGVGTIAAGVAKAYADVILISGHDGGTGASPISSIKNAGSAWEIGLAEAHQVLMMNDLRSRVTLRTDGGMKTGKDIVVAALLGAEEYNFGTSALIAGGCAMFRVCHLNSCPVGVATQREDLRAKFRGKPENIVNFFNAVADDVRRIMADLGVKTMDEMIGRTDLLEQVEDPSNPKTRTINFSRLLHNPDPTGELSRIHTRRRNDRFGNEGSLDDQILQVARETVAHKTPVFRGQFKVTNINRNIGTRISGEVAYLHGNTGLQPGTLNLDFVGSAGQSLGAFLVQGIRLRVFGDTNDYVGKSMNGGEIIIRPRSEDSFVWNENIIMGNTCLYGATGGLLFAAGQAGERFGVRNSGATAVIEGLGDHGCEYMTGGTIVCLGRTGRNFGAGMSGGLAFVYDPDDSFKHQINPDMVFVKEDWENAAEKEALKALIEKHLEATESPHAKKILDSWEDSLKSFRRVTPFTADEVREPVFEMKVVGDAFEFVSI